MSQSKIYFYHTTKLNWVKLGLVQPCTIAIRKQGDIFEYGIAICSKDDNFNKKLGRELATERLLKGFGSINVRDSWKSYKLSENDTHFMLMEQLRSLAESSVTNQKKWFKRLRNFNHSQVVETVKEVK
jgi:hypothetical protein